MRTPNFEGSPGRIQSANRRPPKRTSAYRMQFFFHNWLITVSPLSLLPHRSFAHGLLDFARLRFLSAAPITPIPPLASCEFTGECAAHCRSSRLPFPSHGALLSCLTTALSQPPSPTAPSSPRARARSVFPQSPCRPAVCPPLLLVSTSGWRPLPSSSCIGRKRGSDWPGPKQTKSQHCPIYQ